MNIIGPDVSFYQDKPDTERGIDFARMKAAGAQFVIIRAGQNLWEDNEFDISWKASKGILPRGSYWFYDSRVDPKLQARKWISAFADPADLGELPLWCDFEDTYKGPFHGWRHWYTFMVELQRLAPGKQLGIYTGYYYWKENTLGVSIPIASLDWFKQFFLWIANYGVTSPLVPLPWNTWTLWQYTDNGDGPKYGVESLNIDLNYFNGNEDALRAAFGLDAAQPDPEPETPTQPDIILRMELKHKSGKVTILPAVTEIRQELIEQKQYALELDRQLQTGEMK